MPLNNSVLTGEEAADGLGKMIHNGARHVLLERRLLPLLGLS